MSVLCALVALTPQSYHPITLVTLFRTNSRSLKDIVIPARVYSSVGIAALPVYSTVIFTQHYYKKLMGIMQSLCWLLAAARVYQFEF